MLEANLHIFMERSIKKRLQTRKTEQIQLSCDAFSIYFVIALPNLILEDNIYLKKSAELLFEKIRLSKYELNRNDVLSGLLYDEVNYAIPNLRQKDGHFDDLLESCPYSSDSEMFLS